jgi:hypothetical protein
MVKFVHLFVLLALIIWLAGSGCVGNNISEVKKSGVDPNAVEAGNGVPAEDQEIELTQNDISKLDSDMAELEILLEDASLEEVEVEEL